MRISKSGNKRVLKKKKGKSESSASAGLTNNKKRFATKKRSGLSGAATSTTHAAVRQAPLGQKMTILRKKQAQERMVLKEHLLELRRKKLNRTKGDDAKTERRQMGKYIKELKKQQVSKHAGEISTVSSEHAQNALLNGNYDDVRIKGPPTMHRKKEQRYLLPPQTVGLPHGKNSSNPVPIPSNVSANVNFLAQTRQQQARYQNSMNNSMTINSNSNSNNNNNNNNQQQQQQQNKRWQNNSNFNNEDEWIDVDDDGAIPMQQHKNTRNNNNNNNNNGGNNNNNNDESDKLRQLFSGFGVK